MAGRQGIEPCKVGFGDQPAPSAQPEMADDRPLEDHTLADTTRFPAGSSALAGLSSKMAETAGVEPARPGKAITGFRPDKHAVACLHEMAEGGVSKLRSVSPSSVFEAATGYLPATPSNTLTCRSVRISLGATPACTSSVYRRSTHL